MMDECMDVWKFIDSTPEVALAHENIIAPYLPAFMPK